MSLEMDSDLSRVTLLEGESILWMKKTTIDRSATEVSNQNKFAIPYEGEVLRVKDKYRFKNFYILTNHQFIFKSLEINEGKWEKCVLPDQITHTGGILYFNLQSLKNFHIEYNQYYLNRPFTTYLYFFFKPNFLIKVTLEMPDLSTEEYSGIKSCLIDLEIFPADGFREYEKRSRDDYLLAAKFGLIGFSVFNIVLNLFSYVMSHLTIFLL